MIGSIYSRYSEIGMATLRTSLACFILLNLGITLPVRASEPFDYYVLSLSWAPAFCAPSGAASANPEECAPGRGIGFIVHGLWPEAAAGRSPESCGTAKPVPKSVVDFVLRDMLSPGLIQHEWATHGVCSGLK